MQPSFVDPSLWAPSPSYGTTTAFPDPVACDPGASLDLFAAPPKQPEDLVDKLSKEWIRTQECAPPPEITAIDSDSIERIDFGFGLDFDFSGDIHTSGLDGFSFLDNHNALETETNTHAMAAGNWSPVFAALQPCTPSSLYQDSSSASPAPTSIPSSPSSSASSPASTSTSSSPSSSRSWSPYSPYFAGKRSVTQPSRNAQIPQHTAPKPARANECRYCHCRFGRPADVSRHEKTHFVGDYQYACLGVPVDEAGECDDTDIANGFMHDGKLMVHGCLTTFKDRRDSYRRHLATRGCPGSKAGYWANVKEVAAAKAKRKVNGY
ncbi:transcription factor [Ganoderma sinense ZZ0214-1]|uniref:Transcription factor n=1 Tax=Ganoderma sinense ZZ0214-1 TaxID=1077348 RepID=A0A2G8RN30_9APHY|nr:transcription factor [Ganoderma sinense ZZ0214-1]